MTGALAKFEQDVKRPKFIPYDLQAIDNASAKTALATYARSDAIRARQRPDWDRALKLGEQGIAQDAAGDSTLLPAAQAEAMRAGVGDSLAAFGDTGGSTLAAGSAATAKVSQNLFGSVNALGQQIRDNRTRALTLGDQLFPERQIGLSGDDAAGIVASNTSGLNSWKEADFRDKLESERLNWRVQNENTRTQVETANNNAAGAAQAGAAKQQAFIQGGAAIAGVAVLAIAL